MLLLTLGRKQSIADKSRVLLSNSIQTNGYVKIAKHIADVSKLPLPLQI